MSRDVGNVLSITQPGKDPLIPEPVLLVAPDGVGRLLIGGQGTAVSPFY